MLCPTQEAKFTVDEEQFRAWLVDSHPKLSLCQPRRTSAQPRVLAGHDQLGRDTVTFNLSNLTGDTVELMEHGWKISSDPERYARRDRTTGGLPRPIEPPSLPVDFTPFRRLLNLRAESDWKRCLCWLLAAMKPEGPYPVLTVTGPKGSGKTTAALLIRSLIDPAQRPFNGLPHWVMAFDNVASIPTHVSEAIRGVNHPVILVIPDAATLPQDLSDRAIVVHMDALPERERRSLVDLWQKLKTIRPRILGCLLTSVSTALRNRKQAGFADLNDWLFAAHPAIQLSKPEIAELLKPEPVGSVDEIAQAIGSLLENTDTWSGTASKLMKALQALERTTVTWPRTAQAISRCLNRALVRLRQAGISMTFHSGGEIRLNRTLSC